MPLVTSSSTSIPGIHTHTRALAKLFVVLLGDQCTPMRYLVAMTSEDWTLIYTAVPIIAHLATICKQIRFLFFKM